MKRSTPEGYNEHDYWKVRVFLEQTDEYGVKNGEKLSEYYDPNDPTSWGTRWCKQCFQWIESDGELRIKKIYVSCLGLCGTLDVSGCTTLEYLDCDYNTLSLLDASGCTALAYLKCDHNNLTSLNVSNNTALHVLYCANNNLTELNVSGCTELRHLNCSYNSLTALDVSGCTALKRLWCFTNKLAELNVSGCAELEDLYCYDNNLTTLDLRSCPQAYCFCDDGVNILREQGGSKR